MPIIIDEMVIQVEVNENRPNAPSTQPPTGTGNADSGNTEMIRKCLEEVMEVLRHQKER